MRGNLYSRNHTTLDPDADSEFWDYSFPELMYDHQANIQYILDNTGLSSISYCGVAVGATSMYASLVRENEWFRQRVNLFVSIEQIVRNSGLSGVPSQLVGSSIPYELLRRNHIYELVPNSGAIRNSSSVLCGIFPIL